MRTRPMCVAHDGDERESGVVGGAHVFGYAVLCVVPEIVNCGVQEWVQDANEERWNQKSDKRTDNQRVGGWVSGVCCGCY